jgi:hypothetical protein
LGHLESETELEAIRHDNRVRESAASKLFESQLDVYLRLWQVLQALKLLVDSAWESATRENVALLAQTLQETKAQINNWSLLLDDKDVGELNRLFQILEEFRAGKQKLVRIKSADDVVLSGSGLARMVAREAQVEENRRFKEDFEGLLGRLRVAFRNNLSRKPSNEEEQIDYIIE